MELTENKNNWIYWLSSAKIFLVNYNSHLLKGMKPMSIRIGIIGYGNLGRGVECAIRQNPDMELKAVFTRRNPESVKILTAGGRLP